jgi:hypothetical protein
MHQNLSKVVSFDGHLPCLSSDYWSTAALEGVSMFTCLFSFTTYRIFYVLLLRKAWHSFKEAFVIDVFYNLNYTDITIWKSNFLCFLVAL